MPYGVDGNGNVAGTLKNLLSQKARVVRPWLFVLFGDEAVLGVLGGAGGDAVRAKQIAANAALRDGRNVWVIFTGVIVHFLYLIHSAGCTIRPRRTRR